MQRQRLIEKKKLNYQKKRAERFKVGGGWVIYLQKEEEPRVVVPVLTRKGGVMSFL